jgi:hypothetical protein
VISSDACASAEDGATHSVIPSNMKNRRTINNIPEKNKGRASSSLEHGAKRGRAYDE